MTASPVKLAVSPTDRILMVAAHPDDETLAAGGLLASAATANATVRVVFVTDGDHNPWVQRLYEKRLTVHGTDDKARYASLRRAEALAAAERLGLPRSSLIFYQYPDQGLTSMIMGDGERLVARLAGEFTTFAPTMLVIPSMLDVHPDHNAIGAVARMALDRLGWDPSREGSVPFRVLSCVVHGAALMPPSASDARFHLGEQALQAKREALSVYATQLAWRPSRLTRFVTGSEGFNEGEPGPGHPRHPLVSVTGGPDSLWLEFRRGSRYLLHGKARLFLVVLPPGGGPPIKLAGGWRPHHGTVTLWPVAVHLRDSRGETRQDGPTVVARVRGRREHCLIQLPRAVFPAGAVVFVKLERRCGFFDDAGWMRLVLPPTRAHGERPRVCAVVPCYNVEKYCGDVVAGCAAYADRVIAVDDGSTDKTAAALRGAGDRAGGHVEVLSLARNGGKGRALLAAFQHALQMPDIDCIVTLDGDGQHRPEDIPTLVDGIADGAQLVVGERLDYSAMPWRSLLGNRLTREVLQRLFPGCPADTQSGFRAFDRAFATETLNCVEGSRYETELQTLLLALERGRRLATVEIPTIYIDNNQGRHFRALDDSLRVASAIAAWLWRRWANGDGAPRP